LTTPEKVDNAANDHEAAIVIDGNFRYAVDTESYGALNFSTKKSWFFT
jgi:hypothetical protein